MFTNDGVIYLLDTEYCELNFQLKLLDDSKLPQYKNSMLVGAFLNGMLNLYCFNKKDCKRCQSKNICSIQVLLNNNFNAQKPLVLQSEKIQPLFLIKCIDRKTNFKKDSILKFNVVLIGQAIDFLSQFIYIFDKLGDVGIGSNKSKYLLEGIYNQKGQPIYKDGYLYEENININRLSSYINMRKRSIKKVKKIEFITPYIKIEEKNNYIDLNMDNMFQAIEVRLRTLNILENLDRERFKLIKQNTYIKSFHFSLIKRKYFIKKQNTYKSIIGFKGSIEFKDNAIEYIDYLLACEKMLIGNNILLGFGEYVVKEE